MGECVQRKACIGLSYCKQTNIQYYIRPNIGKISELSFLLCSEASLIIVKFARMPVSYPDLGPHFKESPAPRYQPNGRLSVRTSMAGTNNNSRAQAGEKKPPLAFILEGGAGKGKEEVEGAGWWAVHCSMAGRHEMVAQVAVMVI